MYKQYYEKKYGMTNIRHISVGPNYQVDPANIPLITDVLDKPEEYEQEKLIRHDFQIEIQ